MPTAIGFVFLQETRALSLGIFSTEHFQVEKAVEKEVRDMNCFLRHQIMTVGVEFSPKTTNCVQVFVQILVNEEGACYDGCREKVNNNNSFIRKRKKLILLP